MSTPNITRYFIDKALGFCFNCVYVLVTQSESGHKPFEVELKITDLCM